MYAEVKSLGNFPDRFMAEIAGQPDALRRAGAAAADQARAIAAVRASGHIVFTGMGSSYDACYPAVTALGAAGVAATMIDAAELLHFRLPAISANTLVVLDAVAGALGASSRDGSAEAARAAERLLIDAEALAETLADWLGGRPVLLLLARGGARAAAEMGALTLKEAARFPAESLQAAQFRHGPLELAGPQMAAIVMATSPTTQALDVGMAEELRRAGAAVLVVGPDGAAPAGTPTVVLDPVSDGLAPAVAVIPTQLLAWSLARRRGLDPGGYSLASKVTTRE